MEILRPNSRILILREGGGFTGIIMGFLIIGCVIFGVQKYLLKDLAEINLSCDRIEPNQINCQVTRTPLFHLGPKLREKYDSILAVDYKAEEALNWKEGDKSKVLIYRHYIALKTGYEIEPLLLYIHRGRSSEQARNIEKKLNHFLRSEQQAINFTEPIGLKTALLLIFYLILLIVALTLLHLQGITTTLKLDKRQNKLTRHMYSIFGFWSRPAPLDDIQAIMVQENRTKKDKMRFKLIMTMQSGKKYTIGWTNDRSQASCKASQLGRFLHFSSSPPRATSSERNKTLLLFKSSLDEA